MERSGGVMIKTCYKVKVTQDGALWFIKLPSHENIFTQARSLEEIEPMTRDVISLMLNIPKDSYDIELSFDESLNSLEKRSRDYLA